MTDESVLSTSRSGISTVLPDGWTPGAGYSYAVATHGPALLHVAAVAGVRPGTFEFDPADGLLEQWRRALGNLQMIVTAAGVTMAHVAMLRIYVADMASYRTSARGVARLHEEFFGDHRPAASLLGVASLAGDEALVEMDAVVQLREGSD